MGWGKKQVSPEVGAFEHLKEMDDSAIKALLKQHKVSAFKSPKELRKAADKVGFKGLEGEKGMAALLAGLKGGGTGNKNYKNIPEADRRHPSLTRKQVEAQKTAEKAALLAAVQLARATGNRKAEADLRAAAKQRGLI